MSYVLQYLCLRQSKILTTRINWRQLNLLVTIIKHLVDPMFLNYLIHF